MNCDDVLAGNLFLALDVMKKDGICPKSKYIQRIKE
jgi:hypothetical protein